MKEKKEIIKNLLDNFTIYSANKAAAPTTPASLPKAAGSIFRPSKDIPKAVFLSSSERALKSISPARATPPPIITASGFNILTRFPTPKARYFTM